MSNIFSRTNNYVDKPKRNVFDLSFNNNLTMQFGKLYPVFCKEVVPGDSMSITPTFGLKMMPLVFPIQTRMQANLHFFYVRNRNLWKDWADFIGKTKDVTPPYLNLTRHDTKTGSLCDYLGIPTTSYGSYGGSVEIIGYGNGNYNLHSKFSTDLVGDESTFDPEDYNEKYLSDYYDAEQTSASNVLYGCRCNMNSLSLPLDYLRTGDTDGEDARIKFSMPTLTTTQSATGLVFFTDTNGKIYYSEKVIVNGNGTNKTIEFVVNGSAHKSAWDAVGNPNYFVYLFLDSASNMMSRSNISRETINYRGLILNEGTAKVALDKVTDISTGVSNPFADGEIRISALPFRAYESIYNSFYRNQQNDPFMIDGVVEYNKYIPSQEGGEDSNSYDLRYKNWEMDFLTSANPSPQQGIAPLVGVNAAGVFTFQDSDGNQYTAKCEVGEDGETLTGISMHSPDMPQGTLRALVDTISSGISINDFRNVNALQRWLEANMRRGFRYRDQIMTHFGVEAKYEELDMPEFIGGCSEPILVNQISQTADTSEAPLGSYAGQASCIGTSKHSINHYADEHGFIIGIMSVTPVPSYSQLLPKMFLKESVLDYYFPEFGHIGMQPITYKEVCPIQVYGDDQMNGTNTLNDVFGYQRPWYEYLASTDEVHGQFRTTLKDFLMNRVFNEKPELGASFLHCDPSQLNEVFSVTETDDKILGQIHFKVTAKRPIPAFGIPRID